MEKLVQRENIESLEENVKSDLDNTITVKSTVLSNRDDKSSKKYSLEDYATILMNADLRRISRETNVHNKDRLEELARDQTDDYVTESQLYKNAEKLGISREDVDAEIKLRYLTNAEIIEKILKVNGEYYTNEIKEYQKKEIMSALKSKYPNDKFELVFGKDEKRILGFLASFPDHQINVYRIKETPVKKRFFWKTYFRIEEVRERLARISECNGLYLDSPDFLSACSDCLNKIEEKSKSKFYLVERKYKVKVE